MKHLLTFLFLILFSNTLFSQDRIVKRNGEELYVWIKEISETKIYYADTLQNDPTIKKIPKSEVFMIVFRNGLKEIYSEEVKPSVTVEKPALEKITMISNREYLIGGRVYNYNQVRQIMKNKKDKQVDSLLNIASRSGRTGNIIGFASIPFGLSIFAEELPQPTYEAYVITVVSLATVCVTANVINIIFKVKRKRYMRKAVALYNTKIE